MRVTQAPLLIFSRPESFLRRVAIRRRYAFLFSEIDPTRGFRCFFWDTAQNRTGHWASQKVQIPCNLNKKITEIPLLNRHQIFFNHTFFEAQLAVETFRVAKKKIKSGACVTRISTCADLCNHACGMTQKRRRILDPCRAASSLFCRNLW